jgi:hypothetical protein
MAGGVTFNVLTFHLLHKHEVETYLRGDQGDKKTLNNEIKLFNHPANTSIPVSFVAGAMLFGVGWGMSGICPGPGLVSVGASSRVAAAYVPPLLIGMSLHEVYKSLDALKEKIHRGNSNIKLVPVPKDDGATKAGGGEENA